jgi:hypothetical protein
MKIGVTLGAIKHIGTGTINAALGWNGRILQGPWKYTGSRLGRL